MTARVLIIAGSDSGGGAGIQADIKTVTMLGGHAMTAITALTAQNTLGVQAVHLVPKESVIAQIDSVVSDLGVDVIKIGMIGSGETALELADRLNHDDLAQVPVIFDPVMITTSGAALADDDVIAAFDLLMRRCALITPNIDELKALGGERAVLGKAPLLLAKGGHMEGDVVIDRLIDAETGEILRWEAPRIFTEHSHGTGCTLASAIAVGLAQGMPMEPSIARARDFVRLALHNAPGLGQGHGPMGHQLVRNDGLFTGPAINHISVPCKDIVAGAAFYQQMGLKLIVNSPENSYARLEAANGLTLSLQGGCAQSGGTAIYLESGALDAWVAYLARRGVRFDQMPKDEDWGWREAHLADPDGNRICLYQAAEYRRFPPWRVN